MFFSDHPVSIITMVQSTAWKKEEDSRGSVQKKRRIRGGDFKCILCGNEFSRASSIRCRHWAICVRKHGNPGNLVWDQDQSCWPKGRSGPSGIPARGSTEQRGDDTEHKDAERMKEAGRMDGSTDNGETFGLWVTSHLVKLRCYEQLLNPAGFKISNRS